MARAVRVLGTTQRWMVVRTAQQCQHMQYQQTVHRRMVIRMHCRNDQSKRIKEKKGSKKRKEERKKEREEAEE